MNEVARKDDYRTAELSKVDEAPVELFEGNTGLEGVDQDCYQIPFLKIAQPGTEEAKRGSQSKIEGLEPGMFFCKTGHRIYGEKVRIVLLKFYRTFVVYESRDPKAKFLGTVDPETFHKEIEPFTTREKSYALDRAGKRYVDTRNFIILNYDNPMDGPMLMSLSSTGIKPSRDLITQAQNVKVRRGDRVMTAPLWWSVWELGLGYFDNPNGGYYQIKGINHLGGVPNDIAGIYKGAFDEVQAQGNPEMAADLTDAADEEPRHAGTWSAAESGFGAGSRQEPEGRPATETQSTATGAVKSLFGDSGDQVF